MIMTMAQAINRALALEMRRDSRVIILGEDVGVDGGVFRITEGLFDEFGPERVLDTPLAESGIVGASVASLANRSAFSLAVFSRTARASAS